MLKLTQLSKTYNGKDFAVNGLDLELNRGEIFGFLGPNGAGKTTTLKMITGILEPTRGSIEIDGIPLMEKPIEAKKRIAFVPDDPNMFSRFKGIEYLQFMGDIYGVPKEERRKRIEALAESYELSNALGDKIQSYSHGMRQKIVLMGALLHNPPLWILDEPMTGLDPRSAYHLKTQMREHADKGNTVLFSTHVLDVAEKVCDRVGIIDHGVMRFCGTIDELRGHMKENASLESLFLELTDDVILPADPKE